MEQLGDRVPTVSSRQDRGGCGRHLGQPANDSSEENERDALAKRIGDVSERIDALRELLAECPKLGPKVLTNTDGKPWASADSFDSSLRPANAFCRAGGAEKHLHDLRGTACTLMFKGGLTTRQIAPALAWSEAEVEKHVNENVDLDAAARVLASR